MNQDPRLIENARRLRREITPAEKILWGELRGRRFGGYRFRRQHVIDPYIADFYCSVASLVIELDGETHLGREEEDRWRQSYLEKQGLKVLRFWNPDVFDNLDGVLDLVYRECQARAEVPPRDPNPRRGTAPHPRPLSPPGRGGHEGSAADRNG